MVRALSDPAKPRGADEMKEVQEHVTRASEALFRELHPPTTHSADDEYEPGGKCGAEL